MALTLNKKGGIIMKVKWIIIIILAILFIIIIIQNSGIVEYKIFFWKINISRIIIIPIFLIIGFLIGFFIPKGKKKR
jgi:uncharacterized integral membrane protein